MRQKRRRAEWPSDRAKVKHSRQSFNGQVTSLASAQQRGGEGKIPLALGIRLRKEDRVLEGAVRTGAVRKQEGGKVGGRLWCPPAALSDGASLPPRTEEDCLGVHRLIGKKVLRRMLEEPVGLLVPVLHCCCSAL